MVVKQGSETFAGLAFRASSLKTELYRFYLDFYPYYNFTTENNGDLIGPSLSQRSPFLTNISGRFYLLTVIAQGSNFYLYINDKYLTHITESTYPSGSIGLFASRNNLAETVVSFQHAKVWML
jgi:hypothetical protein